MADATEIYNARVVYLDAAIAEINAVCNTVEASPDRLEETKQIAQLAGENAQSKFDAYLSLVTGTTVDNEG